MFPNDVLMQEIRKLPVSEELGLGPEADAFELLPAAIEARVLSLLDQHEKLVQLLYKIDVDEQMARSAFASGRPEIVAPALAELIIKRMVRKAETRLKYRNNEL